MNRSWSKIKLQIQFISGSSIWEDMQEHECFSYKCAISYPPSFPQYPYNVLWAKKSFQVRKRPKKAHSSSPFATLGIPNWAPPTPPLPPTPPPPTPTPTPRWHCRTYLCLHNWWSGTYPSLTNLLNSISVQFKSLMDGDRFFYRHTAGPDIRCCVKCFNKFLVFIVIRPLTGAMLDQIKLRRLSDIICENTDIETITDNVFIQVAQQFVKT